MATMKTRGVIALLHNKNLIPRFVRRRKILVEAANCRTHPNYGKAKSGWHERRKSSLSQVASSSVWLLQCTLKNLIVLHWVTRLFWSKISTRCSGFVKSASNGATSYNMASMCAFKHFFSSDTWKISWTTTNGDGNSNLYATFPHFSRMGNGPM
jgi:hypothetical protein